MELVSLGEECKPTGTCVTWREFSLSGSILVFLALNIPKAPGPDGSSINIQVGYSAGSIRLAESPAVYLEDHSRHQSRLSSNPGRVECNIVPRSVDIFCFIGTTAASGMKRLHVHIGFLFCDCQCI